MTRILVYDDNIIRQDALKFLIELEPDFEFAGGRNNCSGIEFDIAQLKPDIILMDIDMPYTNGIEGLKRAKKVAPGIHVIMQTVFEDDKKILEAIFAGASGYFLKKTRPEKLIEGIREVLNGGAPMTSLVAARVLKAFIGSSAKKNFPDFNLTRREEEILSMLTQGMSYKMIASEINVSYHTVNSHIKKIYEKLQVNSATEAIAKTMFNKKNKR